MNPKPKKRECPVAIQTNPTARRATSSHHQQKSLPVQERDRDERQAERNSLDEPDRGLEGTLAEWQRRFLERVDG